MLNLGAKQADFVSVSEENRLPGRWGDGTFVTNT
jgi:hypothetical protein